MDQSSVDGVRVLHVDDDPNSAESVAEYLEREDERFSVETATSASEGLDRLAEIDCVVSDHVVPGLDGIEFLETVRERSPDLPFILFTGRGSEEVAAAAVSLGVTDYIRRNGDSEQYTTLVERIRNAVERVRAARDRQRLLDAIENAPEGIGVLDEDGHLVYVNDAYANLYGDDPEEVVGDHWGLLHRDEDVRRIDEEVLPSVEETGHWHGEMTGLRADGTTFPEDCALSLTDHGEITCIVRDTTDRERLRTKYELVVEASTDAFWEWDAVAKEVSRSEEYLTQFGYDPSDIGTDVDWWLERVHPDDRDRVLDAINTALEEPETSYDETYRFRKKDGTYGHIRSRAHVVYDENGETVRMVGAYIDITERKEREQELEKFASIVSHDLRNPLSVARGHLELAREERECDHLSKIDDSLGRMAEIIEDTLTLAKQGKTVDGIEPIVFSESLEACWGAVETGAATLTLDEDVEIYGDSRRLQNLFENLFRNAVEHGGEDVSVRVGPIDEEGFYVADDGPGIPETERDAVFEPGHSTLDDGIGFGLAIVEQIVEAHGWNIAVTDSEDDGTRFEVTDVEFV